MFSGWLSSRRCERLSGRERFAFLQSELLAEERSRSGVGRCLFCEDTLFILFLGVVLKGNQRNTTPFFPLTAEVRGLVLF